MGTNEVYPILCSIYYLDLSITYNGGANETRDFFCLFFFFLGFFLVKFDFYNNNETYGIR